MQNNLQVEAIERFANYPISLTTSVNIYTAKKKLQDLDLLASFECQTNFN